METKKQKHRIEVSPEFIKEQVELFTGFKDLSVKSRKREITEARFIAFKITKVLCPKASLSSIGKVYNRDHASVIHGLKKFDDLLGQFDFRHSEKIYKDVLNNIEKICESGRYKSMNRLQTVQEIKSEYRLKFISMTEKFHTVIGKQLLKIRNLTNRPIFEEMAELDDDALDELEIRIRAFMTMNKNRKKVCS